MTVIPFEYRVFFLSQLCSLHYTRFPFGMWLVPVRDVVGSRSGCGWFPFGMRLVPVRDVVGSRSGCGWFLFGMWLT